MFFHQGVASVSISVAAMPQPLGVENPQFIKISNSPVKINTQGTFINLLISYNRLNGIFI